MHNNSFLIEISKEDWKGSDAPSPDDVVSGELYPTCAACSEANIECCWVFRVIQGRMQGAPGGSRGTCEGCSVKGIGCSFVWDVMHSLQKVDEVMERLVRHARLENRQAAMRIADNNESRKWLGSILRDFK